MADLILAGADVVTLDVERPVASAVAISGGRITAVGDRREVRDWRGAGNEVIDLGGGTLVPGLTDSHMHPAPGLSLTAGLDLSACADLGPARLPQPRTDTNPSHDGSAAFFANAGAFRDDIRRLARAERQPR
jgi:predicted amidohydrolase YtcJ